MGESNFGGEDPLKKGPWIAAEDAILVVPFFYAICLLGLSGSICFISIEKFKFFCFMEGILPLIILFLSLRVAVVVGLV